MNLVQIGSAVVNPLLSISGPEVHVVNGKQRIFFVVDRSRIYLAEADAELSDLVLLPDAKAPGVTIPQQPDALSLNIAQGCNLACRYCYADEGRFGGDMKMMPLDLALEAINRHLSRASGGPVSVGFMGGEPLLNRRVLHRATEYAAALAARRDIPISFGITTNCTLLRADDIALLRAYPFAVNISVDGNRDAHNMLRPARDGGDSWSRTMEKVQPLLANPGKSWVAARVTVTRRNMDVASQVETLARAGFQEVGISPMRTGPDAELRVGGDDWSRLLLEVISAAKADWNRVAATRDSLRFTNLSTGLRQLYRGAFHALPCGSAANYISLSADGHYFSCHRTIGDPRFEMGNLETGTSFEDRSAFVNARNVDRQEPCRSCWARYLCGGGCHVEVLQAGRDGCDFIRGWLEFCISLFPDVLGRRPDLLETRVSP